VVLVELRLKAQLVSFLMQAFFKPIPEVVVEFYDLALVYRPLPNIFGVALECEASIRVFDGEHEEFSKRSRVVVKPDTVPNVVLTCDRVTRLLRVDTDFTGSIFRRPNLKPFDTVS
jgi:hypothetical protein